MNRLKDIKLTPDRKKKKKKDTGTRDTPFRWSRVKKMECIFSKQKLVSVLEISSRKEALDRERKGEPPVCSREHSRTYLGGGKDSLKTVCVQSICLSPSW